MHTWRPPDRAILQADTRRQPAYFFISDPHITEIATTAMRFFKVSPPSTAAARRPALPAAAACDPVRICAPLFLGFFVEHGALAGFVFWHCASPVGNQRKEVALGSIGTLGFFPPH
jgi:hypothetical protein